MKQELSDQEMLDVIAEKLLCAPYSNLKDERVAVLKTKKGYQLAITKYAFLLHEHGYIAMSVFSYRHRIYRSWRSAGEAYEFILDCNTPEDVVDKVIAENAILAALEDA